MSFIKAMSCEESLAMLSEFRSLIPITFPSEAWAFTFSKTSESNGLPSSRNDWILLSGCTLDLYLAFVEHARVLRPRRRAGLWTRGRTDEMIHRHVASVGHSPESRLSPSALPRSLMGFKIVELYRYAVCMSSVGL